MRLQPLPGAPHRPAPAQTRARARRAAGAVAVIVAQATNLGLATMATASGIPYVHLLRVQGWYFRQDTLREAIATSSATTAACR